VDAGLEEDLRAVDVARPREAALVHDERADRLLRRRDLGPEALRVRVVAQRVLAEFAPLLRVEAVARAVRDGHRRQVAHDAVAREAEPRRRRRLRLVGRVEDGPVARHAEVHVHADLVRAVAEPREEVLAHGLDARELLAVDERRALGEATVRARRPERLADELAAVPRGDAVHAVALDHPDPRGGGGDGAEEDREAEDGGVYALQRTRCVCECATTDAHGDATACQISGGRQSMTAHLCGIFSAT